MKKVILLFILISINMTAQTNKNDSWSIGAGLSNFTMHGDLRSLETGKSNSENGLLNLGGYIYIDKMLTNSFGFEAKLHYSKMSGTGQEVSGTILNNIPLSDTRFEGNAFGGELNAIINFSTLSSNYSKERKWNYSGLYGMGIHRYDSKLYNLETNELLADYGNGPSDNGKTSSLYFTSSLAVKYKISKKIDLELRQSVNVNEDDHLDAASSNKQNLDFFFKTNLGIVYKLNDKNEENLIWQDNNSQPQINEKSYQKMINEALKDSDGDGVIDRFDKEENTPKNVVVYGNGVAIDSDKDGVPDYKDKCPLEYFKTKTGCKIIVIDSDKDGIPDNEDICPNVFAKTKNGCPKETIKDSDNDGIADFKDKCPNTYAKTLNGCPKKADSDGDNVPDDKDRCPNVYAKNPDGCPKVIISDRDKDGVPDKRDKCPLTYGQTKSGCPKKIITTKNIPVKKAIKTKTDKRREKIIKNINKKNVTHNNIELNNSVNINDVDNSPIYPGCKDKPTKFDKTNCIISKISEYIVKNYDISKGGRITDKVRVLFIVKTDGTTKVIEVLGKYNNETKQEIKRIFKTLPKIKPGTLKGLEVPVKYSLLFVLE